MDIARTVSKLTRRIRDRLRLMVGRCVLLAVNDGEELQQLQVEALAEEVLDRVERFQEYGFASRPHSGAEGILLSVGGVRSHSVVIATEDRRYRLKGLKGGETALYDDQGQVIHLQRDGILVKTDRPNGVKVEAPTVSAVCESAQVSAASITLGEGDAKPIARIGDKVEISSGSSAGVTGTIISGSDVSRSV